MIWAEVLARTSPMHGGSNWFLTFSGALTTTIVVIPALPLVAWLLAAVRRLVGQPRRTAWRAALLDVGLVYGTLVPIWLTMVPGRHPGLVLHPWSDIPTMPRDAIVGNMLLLAGIGFVAPIRVRLLSSLTRTTLVALAMSCAIETCQYVLPVGRVASIDDVILNTAGLLWPPSPPGRGGRGGHGRGPSPRACSRCRSRSPRELRPNRR